MRSVLGAVAEFEKATLVARLAAARIRKGKLGGRKGFSELRPENGGASFAGDRRGAGKAGARVGERDAVPTGRGGRRERPGSPTTCIYQPWVEEPDDPRSAGSVLAGLFSAATMTPCLMCAISGK